MLDSQVIDAGCKRELETLLDVYFSSEERDAEDNLRRGIDDMRAKRGNLIAIAKELAENPNRPLEKERGKRSWIRVILSLLPTRPVL